MGTVRAAVACGVLYGTAISLVLRPEARAWTGSCITNYGMLALQWRDERLARKPPANEGSEQTGHGTDKLEASLDTGNVLRLEGAVWHVRFGEETESGDFPDRKDSVLHHLARLLAEPNRRFDALEFFPPPAGAAPLPHHGRDESSDSQAMAAYEKKLRRLADEIKEANDAHDAEEAARLQAEFNELAEHVGGETTATRLGHKKRCGPLSPEEKADQAIRMALKRFKENLRKKGLPKLADHLEKYLDNGSGAWWYAPPPETSHWFVKGPEPHSEE
jgi:hypothetical protein